MVAMVDDEDHERLSKHKWCTMKNGRTHYAVRSGLVDGKRKLIFMHRELVCIPDGMFTDHIDGDGLNNQKYNIRACTSEQNGRNSRTPKNNTSGYKGVSWRKEKKDWLARIMVSGKSVHLGCFEKKSDAVVAYNEAAKKYHGEFARLNVLA